MLRIFSVFFCAMCSLLLSACMIASGPLTQETISGHWIDQQGQLYALDADGVLGLPGQKGESGVSWVFDGHTLSLHALKVAEEKETETRLTLLKKNLFSLEFSDSKGKSIVWKRSRKAVRRLEGRLFYRERMMLPPEVNVQVSLADLSGKKEFFSLRPANGQDQLYFRVHYLADEFGEVGNLTACVLYGSEPLFATPKPVLVNLGERPSVLLHHAVPCEGAPELVGTYWRLSMLDGVAVEHFDQQPEAHLILREKGQATGSDGCNNFFISWSESDGTISFTPGGATLRLCPNGEEQALKMHQMFPSVDSWQIKGSSLELYSKGSLTAVFEAVEM